MYNKKYAEELLFNLLTNPNRDLNEIVINIPQKTWNYIFLGNSKKFDKFMAKVKETRKEKEKENKLQGYIKNVTFNPPYTTVIWNDGTRTQVVCPNGVSYDKEQGLLNCMAKYLYNNTGDFNYAIDYWLEHGKKTNNYAERTKKKSEKQNNGLESEGQEMARICPITNEKVLYAVCLECEEKTCRNTVQNQNNSNENSSEAEENNN